MGRLIDVDKFKADYGMADDCKDCKQNASLCQYDTIYSKMDFCGWLDDAPTVDAVPVVRCRDCEHKDRESGFCHGRGWPMQLVPDDGFCDKGDRQRRI
jgi:hypothetical protein